MSTARPLAPRPALGTQPRGEPMHVFAVPKGTPARPTIARADGIHMWDTTGKRYIDGASGPVAVNLGYGNERVIEAMTRQARMTAFANLPAFESDANRDLADKLSAAAGPGFERVFVCSGGSEAIEAAIKFARQVKLAAGESGRWKVISRMPSYHGGTLGAVAIGGDSQALDVWGAMVKTMPKVPAPLSYRVPQNFTAETYAEHAAEELARCIEAEGPDSVLAFILEPVGGVATGALVAPDAYYTRVREICDQHGILLIYDEVMCGAGRCGTFMSHQRWTDAKPDISVLAKGIGAGYVPLGIMLTSAELQGALSARGGFTHGHTAVGNPLSCAVGLAVLEETLERGLVEHAATMGARLRDRLLDIQTRSPILGDVRGLGLLQAIEIVRDKESKTPYSPAKMAPAKLCEISFAKGLILYQRRTNGARFGDFVMIAPPLITSPEQIDEIAGLVEESLGDLERALG